MINHRPGLLFIVVMTWMGLLACSGGRIVSWIIYCWLVWCERKTLFLAGNLRSFTSKRTGAEKVSLAINPMHAELIACMEGVKAAAAIGMNNIVPETDA